MQAQTKLFEQQPPGPTKPVGGFTFITVPQLCMVWWCYRQGHISLYDLRVWFACRELLERRCTLKKPLKGHYRPEELQPLVGGRGGRTLDRAVSSLEKAGLLSWSGPDLTLATSPDELRVEDLSSFWAMLEKIKNNRRPIPVPRRVVKLIAGGARRGVIATVLGHLMRCVYYHKADRSCRPVGTAKATWVAEVFGVDERTIRQARTHLVDLGLLEIHPMPGWYVNRYGLRVELNLAWDRPDQAVDADPSTVGEGGSHGNESPGLGPDWGSESPGPYINKELSLKRDSKNQEPAPGGRAGVQKQSQGIKNPPTLRHVVPEDLQSTARLFSLHDQAVGRGLVSGGEHGRLRFVAAAEHARTIGSTNPCGLFVWLVRNGKWEYITQDDEDAAHTRIKQHLYGGRRTPPPAPAPAPGVVGGLGVESRSKFRETPLELSLDARLAQAVRVVAGRTRFEGDPYHLLRREKPDWTRQRWEQAVAELENARLMQLQARYSLCDF